VAACELYRQPLLEHLVYVKLRHWDRAVRELAATALAALTPADPHFVAGAECLSVLTAGCLSPDLPTRHGAACALAAVVRALHACGHALPDDVQATVVAVVPAVEKARLYRGKGGEIMRAAVCRLVEAVAYVRLPLTTALKKALHASLDESLRHPTKDIVLAAAAALRPFAAAYMTSCTADALDRSVHKYAAALQLEPNAAVRRGAALALGALPPRLLLAAKDRVLDTLGAATVEEEDVDLRDAETRVYAVRSLVTVCQAASGSGEQQQQGTPSTSDSSHAPLCAATLRSALLDRLLAAMGDYSTDNRGEAVERTPAHALKVCSEQGDHPIHPADDDWVAVVSHAEIVGLGTNMPSSGVISNLGPTS
jgi:hypothetical protein